jgi:hypothetical protein
MHTDAHKRARTAPLSNISKDTEENREREGRRATPTIIATTTNTLPNAWIERDKKKKKKKKKRKKKIDGWIDRLID